MADSQSGNAKPFDPMEAFRGVRDIYLDAMAKSMVDAVNTEGYAQASGAALEGSLALSAPFREAMEKTMLQVLQQLSLPSRQDFIALAERFTNFEMRLDDIDAKLDQILKQTTPQAPVPAQPASDEPVRAAKVQPAVAAPTEASPISRHRPAPVKKGISLKRNASKGAK